MVRRTEAAAGMLLGVGPQPLPQGSIRIVERRRGGFVTLGGAVLPRAQIVDWADLFRSQLPGQFDLPAVV